MHDALVRALQHCEDGQNGRDRLAETLVREAIGGDHRAARLVLEYTDGTPVQRVVDETPRDDSWPAVRLVLFRVLALHPDVRDELTAALHREFPREAPP